MFATPSGTHADLPGLDRAEPLALRLFWDTRSRGLPLERDREASRHRTLAKERGRRRFLVLAGAVPGEQDCRLRRRVPDTVRIAEGNHQQLLGEGSYRIQQPIRHFETVSPEIGHHHRSGPVGIPSEAGKRQGPVTGRRNPRQQGAPPANGFPEWPAIRLVGTFLMDLDEQQVGRQVGRSRPLPGEAGGPGHQPLRIADERQPAGKKRLGPLAGGRIPERLGERLRRAAVGEEAEARLRLQHAQHRLIEPFRVEPAGAHRADERGVGHHRIARHQDDIHPGLERERRHFTIEASGARALHLQRVAHHQPVEPHLRAKHPLEHFRGQDGRAIVPAVERRHRQVSRHHRGNPRRHRRAEGSEIHRVEMFPIRGHQSEPVVGVRAGSAVSGKVLRSGERSTRFDPSQKRDAQIHHHTRVGTE